MGMFDWSTGSHGSVKESFWVYWAVAIPLTIVTLTCWGLWWNFELNQRKPDVQQAKFWQKLRGRRVLATPEIMMSNLKEPHQV